MNSIRSMAKSKMIQWNDKSHQENRTVSNISAMALLLTEWANFQPNIGAMRLHPGTFGV